VDHLRTIVVGVDFTAPSRTALVQAMRIGAWNRASVKAAHVLDTIVTIELEAALAPMAMQVTDALVNDSREAWAAFARAIPGASDVPCHVEVNNRAFGFLHYARDAHADLIVIGAMSGRKPDTGLGSMAHACVRHAKSDVLIAREDHPEAFKTIVVGVDFSETSMRALERATRIASQDGAALHVVHIYKPPWTELRFDAQGPLITPQVIQKYAADLGQRLRDFCRPLDHELTYLKATLKVHEHDGHRSGLAQYCEEVKADLLVLGTRGRTTLRDVLLGSTAEKALRHASCSVLAIRPG